ncbi:MAG: DNA polymerase I [Synergistaceae bacterium]|nr:DNA polymerase I [Synergistaceae bacterium]
MSKELLLIDGHGLAFRGFYALPESLSASDGTPTNAILGFTTMLLNGLSKWGPDRVGLFFDPKGPTRRHELFKEYKEGRKPTPESFKIQMPLIIEISKAMGIPVFIRDGMEADDYIVSTAKKASDEGWNVSIFSADKDLFQAINGNIKIIRPSKGVSDFKIYNKERFIEEYGFKPEFMSDYLALVGDAVDNIPGVPGIGDKTAKELIGKFGSLEVIFENLEEVPKGRRSKLEENTKLAYSSRDLIIPQITESVPLEELVMKDPDEDLLVELCTRLSLRRLLERMLPNAKIPENKKSQKRPVNDVLPRVPAVTPIIDIGDTPESVETGHDKLFKSTELALVSTDEEKNRFCLFDREGKTASLDLGDPDQKTKWSEWCKHGTLTLFGYRELLSKFDIPLPPTERIRDVEIAHYLLHPDRGGSSIEKTLGHKLPQGKDLAGELFVLWDAFEPEMKKFGLDKLMMELDLPLSVALANLKRNGVFADVSKLASIEEDLKKTIAQTEIDIEELVGERINLNSPKQVGWLLFEHLHLPPLKKTQTGYSTDMSVLEELARLPEPLCEVPYKIIEYREEAKILSGFVQPFLAVASEGDGFIHSTFDHLSTGTGRLSSRDPNVQNMPLFGKWAVRFRDCFIPSDKGKIFVSADYSQIELRVLAHLSGEERLISAFSEGRDVHMETASWVFGLPADKITQEQRRFAKVVNFGLLYGMGAHGLAQRLGISRPQAASMVNRYFSVLPNVKGYLEKSVKEAKEAGYTRSIFGRIRPLAEVATTAGRGNNPIDRVAVNTPIQSAASDIAKIAIMRFDKVIKEEFKGAKTVLQIHDSIVCECFEKDADSLEKRLVEVMESVDVLSVPVKAEPKRGGSLSKV